MSRAPRITNDQRDQITSLYFYGGHSVPEISKRVSLSKKAVRNTINAVKFIKAGDWEAARSMALSGAPRALFLWASARTGIPFPADFEPVFYLKNRGSKKPADSDTRFSAPPGALTVGEYAKKTGLTESAVYKRISSGEIKAKRLPVKTPGHCERYFIFPDTPEPDPVFQNVPVPHRCKPGDETVARVLNIIAECLQGYAKVIMEAADDAEADV